MERGAQQAPHHRLCWDTARVWEGLGRAGPAGGKPRRESPAPQLFCNPLDHFPPSSAGVFASR